MLEIVLNNYKTFSIYGTGEVAKHFLDLLGIKNKSRVSCHIVSPGFYNYDLFEGKK